MKNQKRTVMVFITILLMVALSAFWATPALADDTAPPPTEVPTIELPPVTDGVPAVVDASPSEAPAIEELLAQIPEGTDVVVTNMDGEIVPLASQEAADALAFIDPVWCPIGVAPKTDGTGGCTTSYGSLKLLVDGLMAGTAGVVPGANGTIWIAAGADTSAGAILLDGTDASLGTMETFALTLKGGWNGTSGSSVTNPLTPSTFTQSISIINWLGDITLSDLSISGVTVGSVTNSAALDIETTKKITLTNIDINSNYGAGVHGAYLDNYEGIAVSDVVITNSTFSDNAEYGLLVYSDGTITITNLVANSNGSTGAFLSNSGSGTPKAVTLIGSSNQTKFNGFTGLVIYSKGAVTVNSLSSNGNGGDGAYIDNQISGGTANVAFTGSNTFNGNSSSGIKVYSKGMITINNIFANNNSNGFGAFLDNHTATSPKAVTITVSGSNANSNFYDNFSGGLVINSLGAITVSGLDAQRTSNGNGATLKNDYLGAVGGITFLGWGAFFGQNAGYGLNASSLGNITATNLWAWGNNSYGALLDNHLGTGTVTISVDTSYGNNGSDGLTILSKGAVTLGAIYTNNNNGTGVYIDNSYGTQNVTLNGANHDFNNNAVNGLQVYSYGMITITNLYASNNGSFGAILDNCLQTVPGTCTTVTAKAVTLNGNNNVVEGNGYTGLDITSKGIITTNNLTARDNGGFGAFFDNQMTGATGTINIKNAPTYWAEFARNGLDGLKLHSNGTITIMDLDAYENGQQGDPDWGYGVYLDNASGGGVGNVLLGTNRAFWNNGLNNNFLSGLEVYTNGTITLSNVRANGNGGDNTVDPVYGYGAVLNSSGPLKAVILNGANRFNGNSSGGLYINSLGAITLNNINASDNGLNPGGGDGANLDNSNAATPQAVTLKGDNSFYGNYNNGLQIISKGAITVNNITSSYNGDGAELYNTASGTSSPQNVTLTGFNDFSGNYNNGLDILTFGIITLNNINANDNGQGGSFGFGALLDNFTGNTQVKSVILNGYNSFYNNYTGGLEIHSLGAIIVNNLDASSNTGFGAFLDNNDGVTPSAVSILGGAYTSNNLGYGLQVTSKGAITINVIDAWIGDNDGYGWNLNNNFPGAVGGITLSSVNVDWGFDFWSNGSYGLWAQSLGNIMVTGLDSNQNGGFGATLDNAFIGSVGTITLTAPVLGNNDFSGNTDDGLLVFSNRTITLGALNTNDNGGAGTVLDNTYSGSGSQQNITLTGNNDFHNNGNTGLVVLSYGTITLNNLNVSDNGQNNFYNEANVLPIDPGTGWGAYLDNHTGTTPKGITLTGNNSFGGNFQDGLWATSLGAIKINNLNANWNRGSGAYLDNQFANAVGTITLTTTSALDWNSFQGNGGLGLNIFSNGLITLSNIHANGNTGGGASLDTFGISTAQNVILTGNNEFSDNGDGSHTSVGLLVNADGFITINNLTASGNDGIGADLETGKLTLTGINNFNNNYANGLYFLSTGNVDITKLTADNNGTIGVNGYSSSGSITISCGSMTNNGTYGWQLNALGTITLKGVFALGNINPANTNLIGGTLVTVRTCPLP